MIGFIKKDLHHWLVNLNYNMISLFIITAALFIFTGNNFLIVMAPAYIGMNVLRSPLRDYYRGWDKFALSTPLDRDTLAKSKYILYFFIIIASAIIFTILSYFLDIILEKLLLNYRGNNMLDTLSLVSTSFVMNFLSGAIVFPGYYKLNPEKISVIQSASYTVIAIINYLIIVLIRDKNFEILVPYLVIMVFASIIIYTFSWFITKSIVNNKEYA